MLFLGLRCHRMSKPSVETLAEHSADSSSSGEQDAAEDFRTDVQSGDKNSIIDTPCIPEAKYQPRSWINRLTGAYTAAGKTF